MSELEIGLVRPGELDTVDEVIAAAYAHDYGPDDHGDDPFYSAAYRAEHYDVWVARDTTTGRILGSLTADARGGAKVMSDATDVEIGFRLLGVAPEARRRGVGEALIRHLIRVAAERGLEGVFMKSQPKMAGAHALYDRIGFQRDPARDGLWEGGELVLELYAFRIAVGEAFRIADGEALPTTDGEVAS